MNLKKYTELLLKLSNAFFVGLVITFNLMFLPLNVSLFFISLYIFRLYSNKEKYFFYFIGILFIIGFVFLVQQSVNTIVIQSVVMLSLIIGFYLFDLIIKIPLVSYLLEMLLFYLFAPTIVSWMVIIKDTILKVIN